MRLQEHTEFEIEDLGIVEDYVYDIEVENNHNFFGNGILVHNSIYVSLEPIVLQNQWDKLERKEQIDKIDQYEKSVLQPVINRFCEEMRATVNGFEQRMVWEREVICVDGGIFQAKKRYALLVDNSEGVYYPHPKLKVVGLESNKSSTPEICVPWLKNIYQKAILGDEKGIYSDVKTYKETYFGLPPEEISIAAGVSDISKYRASQNSWEWIKGTPYGAKSAMLHNKLVEEKQANIPLITDGSKLIIANLVDNNPFGSNYIAFQGFWPEEFEDVKPFIDYSGNFEKSFLQPSQLFLDAVGMTTKPKVNVFSAFKKKKENA